MSCEPRVPRAVAVIPLSEPLFGGHEWAYVKECLDTGWVSSAGAFVTRLEQWAVERLACNAAVAVTSGTAALHVALLLAGVRPGDAVVVPSLTFIAPAYAVSYVGAQPLFVDAEADHLQLDPAALRVFFERDCRRGGGSVRHRDTGRPVSAVIVVHVLGHPSDMDAVRAVADDVGLPVIEDATESLGSLYRGRPVGALAGLGCLSFNGNKIATAGGGGLVLCQDEAAAARARYLTTQAKDDPLEYVHREVGFNYRLTNLQAALGLAQVEQLETFVAARRAVHARYAQGLAAVAGVEPIAEAPWAFANQWLSAVRVDPLVYGHDSRWLLARLRQAGVETRPLWQPLHRSPAFGGASTAPDWVADELNRQVLCLPSSASLPVADQTRVITLIAGSASA